MPQSRIKNSIKNTIVAVILKFFQIVLPFASRTIVIKMLGLSYVGISGLFSSIFGVLGIAELGVGSAMLHALYEPIKKKETERVNAIINFYRKAYAIIGVIIWGLGLMLLPFLKDLIKQGTYPSYLNLYCIYVINLFNTVVSYLLYSYKALLLEAHQMGREANKVRIWTTLISYVFQIVILFFTRNYYLYILIYPITTIASAIWISRVADKFYPQNRPEGTISAEEKKRIFSDVKALFLYKIGGVVFNSVDNIVISWWFGAVILGAYNNYYYIVSSVSTTLLVVYSAILPSIGSSTVGASVEHNYKNFMKAAFWDGWLNSWCSICLYCLLDPFIDLWIGEKGNLGQEYALLFAVYFFCWRILDPVSIYKDSLGLWSVDRWRPLITAILNLILNLLLTVTIGLYGILLSSIISVLIISYPFSVKYLFRYFNKSSKEYFIQMFKTLCGAVIAGGITKYLCNHVNVGNSWINLILILILCIVVPNLFCVVLFRNNEELKMLKKK